MTCSCATLSSSQSVGHVSLLLKIPFACISNFGKFSHMTIKCNGIFILSMRVTKMPRHLFKETSFVECFDEYVF